MGCLEFIRMSNDNIKKVLEEAQHELTTLHNLTVTDSIESGITWVTDTTSVIEIINKTISEL